MSVFDFLTRRVSTSNVVASIFPLGLNCEDFIRSDILATYTKILTDTVERTHGIPDEIMPLIWDNCVQSEQTDGLVTLLAKAMTEKRELFLVYVKAVGVLREADQKEKEQIRRDYKERGESTNGVFISFRNYRRTDMLQIYSALEHCIIASLHKTVNVSKAVQIKMSELRASTSLADSSLVVSQAQSIADALRTGQDVLVDVKDSITTATPDVTPTEKAITFLDSKRAYVLGLPIAYVSGLQTAGIGSTGEADTRAVERGLKQYFLTIIKPALKAIFNIDTDFRSQDFRQMTSAIETLKAFDLVSDEYLSIEAKRAILARMFELNEEEEAAALDAQVEENPPSPTISLPQ